MKKVIVFFVSIFSITSQAKAIVVEKKEDVWTEHRKAMEALEEKFKKQREMLAEIKKDFQEKQKKAHEESRKKAAKNSSSKAIATA